MKGAHKSVMIPKYREDREVKKIGEWRKKRKGNNEGREVWGLIILVMW